MQAIPLGRVTVTTPGTLAPLSALAAWQLAMVPTGRVCKIEVHADPASTGNVYVNCTVPGQSALVLMALPKPAGGYVPKWIINACADTIAYAQFSLNADTAGDGAYVTLWVQ